MNYIINMVRNGIMKIVSIIFTKIVEHIQKRGKKMEINIDLREKKIIITNRGIINNYYIIKHIKI